MSTSHLSEVEINKVHLNKVNEFDVLLNVNKESLSPKRNEGYYCQEMHINRALVTTVLSVFCESNESVFTPVKCLDAIGATGIAGLLWKKYLADKVDVHINDPHEMNQQIIVKNSSENNLKVDILKKDPCILLHEKPFSFIYLDCHTDAAFYLDSVMRNIPKQGIIAITTKDDGSLYGRTPEMALRNYGGVIFRTFYSKELATRLIIAGIVRSAAIHSKGLEVLCVLSVKSTITIVVKILKGPAQANACASSIRQFVHCNMCEDRAFYPSSNYLVENPGKLLSCKCAENTPGKVIVNVGPVWSGPLFNSNFIQKIISHATNFPWNSGSIKEALGSLLIEAWCPDNSTVKVLKSLLERIDPKAKATPKSSTQDQEPPPKKPKEDPPEFAELPKNPFSAEPAFYYNLHKHSPKGPQMVKIDKVILSLQKAGFRASRTHFDPLAVRTSARLTELLTHISATLG